MKLVQSEFCVLFTNILLYSLFYCQSLDPICQSIMNYTTSIRTISFSGGQCGVITRSGHIFLVDQMEMLHQSEGQDESLRLSLNVEPDLVSSLFKGFSFDLTTDLRKEQGVETFMRIDGVPHMLVVSKSKDSKICVRKWRYNRKEASDGTANCALGSWKNFDVLVSGFSAYNMITAFEVTRYKMKPVFRLLIDQEGFKYQNVPPSSPEYIYEKDANSRPITAFYVNQKMVLFWSQDNQLVFQAANGRRLFAQNDLLRCLPPVLVATLPDDGKPNDSSSLVSAVFLMLMLLLVLLLLFAVSYSARDYFMIQKVKREKKKRMGKKLVKKGHSKSKKPNKATSRTTTASPKKDNKPTSSESSALKNTKT